MGETLMERRRVEDEGLRIVNSCHERTSNVGEQPATLIVFHFTGYGLPASILFKAGDGGISPHRLPHSEILGSKRLCRLPRLIAA